MKLLFLVAPAAMLAACTASSPIYQAASGPNSVGYLAAPAADGRTTVIYTGTQDMAPSQVAEFAMLRAAELTKAAGREWFAVIQSTTRKVPVGVSTDLQGRAGPNLGGGTVSNGAGGGGDTGGFGSGVGDGALPSGPSTGGFGGGDVPYQVLERWRPNEASQTTLTIQMGSGSNARFDGLVSTPEIFAAADVETSIRAKMAN